MNEITFIVEEAPEGGFNARAVGASIFTEADDIGDLHSQIRDAVLCHFEEGQAPKFSVRGTNFYLKQPLEKNQEEP